MKKLLLLGGLRYLIPVIEEAHKLGIYVITCDYLPNNVAHKYSDKYINASILDRELILKIAREEQIDGIMSFATDPGVLTAAYVAEQMGLPFCGPYSSVEILQNKEKFRMFLTENGFNVPKAKGYSDLIDVMDDADNFDYPVIVKPVDSAGSKGVSKVENKKELTKAVNYALDFSHAHSVIIEDFIEQKGCSSDSDCFSINGELKFVSFSAQRFDNNAENPYTPAAYSWPSTFSKEEENELTRELQRLINLLGLKTSIYNIETRVGRDGKAYIMEVSPRGGGNRLAECIKYATGEDLIRCAILASIGEPCKELCGPHYNGFWAECVLHASNEGVFDSIEIEADIKEKYLIEEDVWVKHGDKVKAFTGANETIGTLVLRFDSYNSMIELMNKTAEWIKINII